MIANPRLVVCDLDGTLVDANKQLRPATIAAVARLRAAGIDFAVISARPRSGVLPIVDALALDGEHGAFNGASIFRRDGTMVRRETVDEAVVRGMFQLTCDLPIEPWVFAGDRWHARDARDLHADNERKSSNQEPIVTGDFAPLYGDVDKLTFVTDDELLLRGVREQALPRFGGLATIAQSQTYYLDVTAMAGNKGDGLWALAASRGVDPSQTIAIGDQANDLPMFNRAGFGIAMGNAPERVKANADAVTLSNDEDGVAHAIKEIILKVRA